MKLLRCYVAAFGKLTDFSYDFDQKLNVILQDNGWGKTTFANFIKSMLFGLTTTTSKDLDKNPRQKYKPWNNANFGGWLEFEMQNKPYRIEREFGSTASKDVVTIYDLTTNQQLDNPDFIQQSLGINADTFERSTYVQQGVFSDASDESIKAKLGKLIQNDTTFDLSQVDKKLTEAQTSYKLLRGKGGKLHQLQEELEYTRRSKSEASSAREKMLSLNEQMANLRQNIEKFDEEISTLRKTQKSIDERKTAIAVQEHYDSLNKNLQTLQEEYNKLVNFFGGKPLTKEELEYLKTTEKEYQETKTKLDALISNNDQEKIIELHRYFASGIPTEEQFSIANQNLQIISSPAPVGQNSAQNKHKRTVAFMLGGVGLIGIALGIALGFLTSSLILGVALGAIAAALSVCGGVLICKKDNSPLDEHQQKVNKATADLVEFVSKYHESTEQLQDAVYNIKHKLSNLRELEQANTNVDTKKEELKKQKDLLFGKLTSVYEQYFGDATNFEYNYQTIQQKISKIEFYSKQIADKQQEIDEFTKTKTLPTINEEETADSIDENVLQKQIADIEVEKQEVIEEQKRLFAQIDNYSKTADLLSYYTSKEEELEEQLAICTQKWSVISQTRDFIQKAKDNLTARYLSPLTQAFEFYSTKLLGKNFGKISIDTDLNVLVDEQGSNKSTKAYSQGTRDIIELCLRLALLKVLFEDDLPPMILDDPFYNLDDDKIENAKKLLKDLCEELQVIYLVCHSSRA